jgi:hypothetical protein
MTTAREPSDTPRQPPLSELLAGYLQRQAIAHEAGLAFADIGEVVPHEAAPAQPVDPRLAWSEALGVLPYFHAGFQATAFRAPPDWPTVVATHEPAVALAFCVGNFPQLVRNLQPLLQARELSALRSSTARPMSATALLDWATQTSGKRSFPQVILALSALRLLKQFDRAAELVRQQHGNVPAEWQAAWDNEEAALAWHQGRADEAATCWQAQLASVPVLFNRGMAALFTDRPVEARTCLSGVVDQLPEGGAWHHLGRLYLAMAEMRG